MIITIAMTIATDRFSICDFFRGVKEAGASPKLVCFAILFSIASPSHDLRALPTPLIDRGEDNHQTQDAWHHVASGVFPPGGGFFNINNFVGATSYYNVGITGQNTKSIVAEGGTVWNGTESLTHVTNFYSSTFSYGGTNQEARIDRHATWVGGVLGGRLVDSSPQIYQQGIAYGTTLGSAGIASTWSGNAYSLSFSWTYNSWTGAIFPSFNNADVINNSYGLADGGGTNVYTRMMDALANSNSKVVSVAAAGNIGSPGSVGSPASGYNTISVGALGDANNYDSVASFSSRGPQNWAYHASGGSIVVVTNARAGVDIVAPGSSIVAPFYGGQTGGNNPTLAGSTNLGTNPASYSIIGGTSFSSPIVAGGASLMISAAKTMPELVGNSEALESVVIKALMLNGATKITGWDNGQTTNNGVVTTTQALDFDSGAGALNLATTSTNQTQGQTGVAGKQIGNQGLVDSIGWDFGAGLISSTNTYMLTGLFASNAPITATLSWLRQVSMNTDSGSANATDLAEANLDLKIWTMEADGSIGTLVGSSETLYNLTEHLHFQLPDTGYYIVGVTYTNNSFDNTGGWGSGSNTQDYGIAWNSSSFKDIYLQNSAWGTNSVWNTSQDGQGIETRISSVAVNTFFGTGDGNQTPQTINIEGENYSLGLRFQSGETTFVGSNSPAVNIGANGLIIGDLNPSINAANIRFDENTTISILDNQHWVNNSSSTLFIDGNIIGSKNLTIDNAKTTSSTEINQVSISGNLYNTGLGKTTISGVISDSLASLSQSGGGILELNGANLYTGTTAVTGGRLVVNGSISESELTTVSNTGLVQGSGTLGSTLVTFGGTISPGNSVGMLTIDGDLTWDVHGNYNWEIVDATGVAGIGYDTIHVSGFLDLSLLGDMDFKINLWSLTSSSPDQSGNASNFDPNQDYLWTLVSTGEGIIGFNSNSFEINTLAFNGTDGFSNDLNGSFIVSSDNNDLILAYNAVPEPSTYVLLLLAGLALSIRFLKKRKI
jgi:autotransporter-associated beta strand protein